MKILLVEDDLTSRRMLEAMVGKWNYEVIATSDAREAWQVMQAENPPAMIILDWMMPGMDGLEFCRKVREAVTLPPTYIILLTSRRYKDDVIVGLKAGVNDCIRKPFDREELHARIRVGEGIVEMQSGLAK